MKHRTLLPLLVIFLVLSTSAGYFDESELIYTEDFDDESLVREYWTNLNPPDGCAGWDVENGFLSYQRLEDPCVADEWGADDIVLATPLQYPDKPIDKITVDFQYDFPQMGEFAFAGRNLDSGFGWSVSIADSWTATTARLKFASTTDTDFIRDNTDAGAVPQSGNNMTLTVQFDYLDITYVDITFDGDFHYHQILPFNGTFTHFSIKFAIKVEYESPETVMKVDRYVERYIDEEIKTITNTVTNIVTVNSTIINIVSVNSFSTVSISLSLFAIMIITRNHRSKQKINI